MFLINPYILQASGNPLWNDLLAYYTADNTPNDALGNSNLSLINGATYDTGIISNGFSFDGVNDKADGGDVNDISGNNHYSISLWVYPTAINRQHTPISKMISSTAQGYFIRIESSNKIRLFIGQNASGNANYIEQTTATITAANTWHHIVVTQDNSKDANNITMYVNGTSVPFTIIQNGIGYTTAENTNTFSIGSQYGTTLYFQGRVDEVALFEKELSASEVTELYNSGAGKQYPN